MKQDLTGAFIEARSHAERWTLQSFWHVIHVLKENLPQTVIDFDYDAGERWASIHGGSEDHIKDVIVFVRIDLPLIIVLDTWADDVEGLLADTALVIVRVPDMASEIYSLDPSQIGAIFPNDVWSPVIDPHCFSIGDLWYTTV